MVDNDGAPLAEKCLDMYGSEALIDSPTKSSSDTIYDRMASRVNEVSGLQHSTGRAAVSAFQATVQGILRFHSVAEDMPVDAVAGQC